MKIINQKKTVSSVVFGRPAGFVYFFVTLFFIYKILTLLPVWITSKDKSMENEMDYEKKIESIKKEEERQKNSETDKGRERYQKEFFNKLDTGENLIILYGEEEEKIKEEKLRKMFWWDEVKQDIIVWWKNKEFFKK